MDTLGAHYMCVPWSSGTYLEGMTGDAAGAPLDISSNHPKVYEELG